MMLLLILPTFLAAFLLFQIELIIAKLFLPNYGGSYLVWGACLVFFQGVLLAGYLFAHTLIGRLGMRKYLRIHAGLLLIPLFFFPLRASHLTFTGASLPLVLDIFWRLVITIGPVFFVLSTMSLVTQSWFTASKLNVRNDPWRLYAVSNFGSLAGLLSYPFILERYLAASEQLQIWRVLYLFLAAGSLLAWRMLPIVPRGPVGEAASGRAGFPRKESLRWLCLGAAGVMMFMSVTNIVTYEVAPVPLLWVIPLAIYLAAFILNFKRKPWCPAWISGWIGPIIGWSAMMYFLAQEKGFMPALLVIIILCAFLFLICMYIQQQLILSKPASSDHMTLFYVMISLGGFLGGMATSWVIPLVSNTLSEYMAGLLLTSMMVRGRGAHSLVKMALCALVALAAFLVWPFLFRSYHVWSFLLLCAAVGFSFFGLACDKMILAFFVAAIMVAAPGLESVWQGVHFIVKERNYYGIYEVYDAEGVRLFMHGTTLHGLEFTDAKKRLAPLGYYSPISPIGSLLIDDVFQAKRLGVVGLGAGGLSIYAKLTCPMDYFELDGDVYKLASEYFWYLRNAPGDVNVILGDARISLSKMPDQAYDLLVIDAFSGDSIPIHLVNRDVLAEYRRKLKPRGGIAFHITNRYLNLKPVLAKIADDASAHAACKDVGDQGLNMRSIWCVLTWDDDRFIRIITRENWEPLEISSKEQGRVWSDDYSSILPIINLGQLSLSLRQFQPLTW